jgi:hypothetical protein
MKRLFLLAFAATLLSCSPTINNPSETGLQGQVLRGPITPVCTQNAPCDAPFSAWFIVLKDDRKVSRFQSDINGEFAIALDPGVYAIVPDNTAPLMHPQQQRKEVEVQPEGITHVTLQFNTGIR